MSIRDVYNLALENIIKAESIYNLSNTYFNAHIPINGIVFDYNAHRETINHSFLLVFTALEEFLENSFIEYMLGKKPLSKKVITRFVKPKNKEHAINILKGLSSHIDFTNTDTIIKLAENYFDNGGPYINLTTFTRNFENMKKIRNRITHISDESQKRFKDMVINLLGNYPNNYSTASFLNDYESKSHLTYFNYYKEETKLIIENISKP